MITVGPQLGPDRGALDHAFRFQPERPALPDDGARFMKAGLSAGALLLTGSLVGWSASAIGAGTSPAPAPAPAAAPAAAPGRTIGASADSYAPLVDQIAPAVVTVTSERRVQLTSSQLPDDPLLRQFFGDQFRGRQHAARAP